MRTRLLRSAISGASSPFAINGSSSELEFDYQSAYSLIPARVHLEGVTLRGRDQSVEWRLTLDRADVTVSLPALLQRTFRATRLLASGLTLRARLRLTRADAIPSIVAALPPIPGFADPPLLEIGPPPLPLTDADYDLWTLDFPNVDVEHVRELWIHTLRSAGDTRARGRWLFRPQRWLDVGPAIVDANGVDLFHGKQPLASGLRGSFGATIRPFDVRWVDGLAILDHISFDGGVRGRAVVAGTLRLLASGSGIGFTRWETPFEARVVVRRGKLADGTHVRTDTTEAEVETMGLTFAGPIRSELGVTGGVAAIDTRISGLRVSELGTERARVASIAAAVTSRQPRLARFFEDARFQLDFSGAETNDLGSWKHFLPATSTFLVRSGPVTVDGHADGSLREMRGRAELRLFARQLSVERGRDQFTADVTGHARILDASLPGGWGVGSATITLDDSAARLGRAVLTGKLVMNVELRRGTRATRTLDLSGSNVSLQSVAVGSERSDIPIMVVPSLSAVAPRFVLAPSGIDGHASVDLPRAELVNLARLHELYRLPKGIRIERGAVRAGFHADVELGFGAIRGSSEVLLRGLRARVGSTRFFGDVAVTVKARRNGGAKEATDFAGSTLAVTRASTGKAVRGEDAWWGKLVLREATLRTREGARFDAKAHLSAKDASPATILVADNTAVPTWAANIFRMPILRADGVLRVRRSSLEVRSVVARGGGTSLRAEYAKRGGRQDGGVLMDLGWIGLGYDLSDGATGLVLIGPESWFKRKVATMRHASAAAKRKSDAGEEVDRYAAMTPELRWSEASELAAHCALDVRTCNDGSIESLLRAAVDPGEHDTLSGLLYAPLLVAAAKHGTDGATLEPLIIGSLAEALRRGGASTLDNIPSAAWDVAVHDPDAARGKVMDVIGRVSSIRHEGSYSIGTLTTDAEPVYFVTPFAVDGVSEAFAHFRGVFVQRCTSSDRTGSKSSALVLVGAFRPRIQEIARASGAGAHEHSVVASAPRSAD